MTGHPLGHVRDTVLELPEYDLKILLNGYPAHSARCRRASAQRDRIRQPDYDPSDRVRNERLDVVCDCGTDRRYICYLEDQLQALRTQVPAVVGDNALAREVHAAWRDGMLSQSREVASHRMTWDTLGPEDRALDAYIAQRVAGAALRAQAEADDLTRAAAAYREARAPLDSLRAAETAATAVCYDRLGHYIGTREQYLAMHAAIDAMAEQQGRIAQAERALRTAALAQSGTSDRPVGAG
ncbi:hypothetical protein [Deinococcus sp. 12RED42]|uniref:hypothetical protein n=1 Tax=Deinococcus sp. 12RED42 TaxID=2745872 RepID=UPI001E56C7A5|nr:hypothetical protein [Deinococcus sp. 12RED42]MCD0167278.1 hypothetical protein [Deinococcus sp. 12RED42]